MAVQVREAVGEAWLAVSAEPLGQKFDRVNSNESSAGFLPCLSDLSVSYSFNLPLAVTFQHVVCSAAFSQISPLYDSIF